MNKIRKFLALDATAKRTFLEAIAYLVLTSVLVKLFPFRWIAPYIGEHMEESVATLDTRSAGLARLIKQSIRWGSIALPWRPLCLPQAIAAKLMLRRAGIGSTLYMGVKTQTTDNLRAHAWLRVGQITVTGEREKLEFVMVARFS